jgi:hypothetical protein
MFVYFPAKIPEMWRWVQSGVSGGALGAPSGGAVSTAVGASPGGALGGGGIVCVCAC